MSYASYEAYLADVFNGQPHVDRVGQCFWCGAPMREIDWAESRRVAGRGQCEECEERDREDERA